MNGARSGELSMNGTRNAESKANGAHLSDFEAREEQRRRERVLRYNQAAEAKFASSERTSRSSSAP